ncbi:hypothetical protein C5B42_01725 [Candidatus Cerribacteria bacterium 'Amazon FNV 2010 28 9']|uniref:Uncharacterized protein n=1 Tax=Candidatus Cerribacteria bacterium 'Amazon FNV 2010 28 9' TaxID=2081795 RepID=A0A317JQJ2_9BACT|nr:MAG: hypothetical protein C5B42_01725 [Candidatus Cerribacteria bacterium 'Amazon FNV 2010 28 9']
MNDTLANFNKFWAAGQYREALREIVIFLFAVDSIGSIFTRGAIWFGIAIAIMIGVDSYDKHAGEATNLKSSVGFFLFFLALGGLLMYLLFGFVPFVGSAQAAGS